MNIDEIISFNIKTKIKNKYKNVTQCALLNEMTPSYLNNTIGKIKKGVYPSITRLKEIAKFCECDFTEFFKIENLDTE
ncbi:hypothetical protein [Fusobacterium varium]|jgi:hypothetical protein|uniref:hypothetical protein n=1 Tax=Fusobacterium varium TaxID=856 RepID=UPI00266DA41D|nr:hypothetical protein [Fusobacterium varium]